MSRTEVTLTVVTPPKKSLLQPAKDLQTQYLPQIRQKANGLEMGEILSMVRGR